MLNAEDGAACDVIFSKLGDNDQGPLKLGVSRCLMGDNVRYDGGHQLDRFIRDVLGKFVQFVPVCPEVECGLPIPREAMRLVGEPGNVRLLTQKSGVDHTDRMVAWAEKRLVQLEAENLCGFIFKSKSPSSGMERVKLYDAKGQSSLNGVGIFAGMFMKYFPLLPVEEEGRLNDVHLREEFIERIFVMRRFRDVVRDGFSFKKLLDFHTAQKLLLLAHSPAIVKDMGRLLAARGELSDHDVHCRYLTLLDKALKTKTTVRKHVNVLQHAAGYFKRSLTPDEKAEMVEVVEAFHMGYTPLIVPVTLINHYVRKYDQAYLKLQTYLKPHPIELKLRNHA